MEWRHILTLVYWGTPVWLNNTINTSTWRHQIHVLPLFYTRNNSQLFYQHGIAIYYFYNAVLWIGIDLCCHTFCYISQYLTVNWVMLRLDHHRLALLSKVSTNLTRKYNINYGYMCVWNINWEHLISRQS